MSHWEKYLQANESRFVEELLDLLRIPSISTSAEHAAEVRRAAEWVAARLRAAGMEAVDILPTGGHPAVAGEWLHAPGRPTVLIYGHFDVQPADPLELWSSPPFEPVIREGRVYARGASDMKSNLLLSILAVEALLHTDGALPLNVKFLFEGEEEIGSAHLSAFIAGRRDLLACDLAISADGGQWTEDQPSLTVAGRGLCGLQIDLRGARTDLHSGLWGGAVQNPIHALAELLASMRNPEGKILVEGFYDDVRSLSERDKALMAAVPFDEADCRATLGVEQLFGEPGYSTVERRATRPTLEVNGIWGGYQGEGVKTVLPSEAHAKITCRLVPDQEPARIRECLMAHIAGHSPSGVTTTICPMVAEAWPYEVRADHPGHRAAHAVLEEIYGKAPYYIRGGGSLPVVDLFRRHLGTDMVMFGFSLEDEQFHAPDEFFRLRNFQRGQRAYVKLLQRLRG
jgi:acetylornithine deacetylase/succinyl-diaminopimelate desuccinylase-like protein